MTTKPYKPPPFLWKIKEKGLPYTYDQDNRKATTNTGLKGWLWPSYNQTIYFISEGYGEAYEVTNDFIILEWK